MMLFGLRMLVLFSGFLAAAGVGEPLFAQSGGSCWLRTEVVAFNPVSDPGRSAVNAAARKCQWLLGDSAWAVKSFGGSVGGPAGKAGWPAGWSNVAYHGVAARLNNLQRAWADFAAWGLDVADGMATTWEQLGCVRAAAQADEADRRFTEYWNYYAAWDRWFPGESWIRIASLNSSAEEAFRSPTPLDRQLALLLEEPPHVLRQATLQIGGWATSAMELTAKGLLDSNDQLVNWMLLRWIRDGLHSVSEWQALAVERFTSANWLPHLPVASSYSWGVSTVCVRVETWVVSMARGVQSAAKASVDVLGWVPVEAIGHVWPD